MATYTPIYYVTVYAPRSEDATEATVLAPVAGAAHTDQFKVATVAGVAGFQPYLGTVRGGPASLDPVTGKATLGEMVLQVMDKRVGTDGSNLRRWLTAFLGNTKGRGRLNGCKVVVEESLDGGATKAPIYTGRFHRVGLAGRLLFDLPVRDLSEDLKAPLFVGPPHSSVTYAATPYVVPVGVPVAYGRVAARAKLTAKVQAKVGAVTTLSVLGPSTSDLANLVTDLLERGAGGELGGVAPGAWVASFNPGDGALARVRVTAKRLDTSATGTLKLLSVTAFRRDGQFVVLGLRVEDDGLVLSTAAVNTTVEWAIEWIGKPTPKAPLVVGDVHPVALFRDIVDGKFGHLAAAGAVLQAVARDTTTFNALIADLSFGTFRGLIEDTAEDGLDWCAANLFKAFRFGYRWTGDGKVEVVDLRPPVSLAGIPTIGNADVWPTPAPEWSDDGGRAYTRTSATYYLDQPLDLEAVRDGARVPDVPVSAIRPSGVPLVVLNTDLVDTGVRDFRLDAKGVRAMPLERVAGLSKEVVAQQFLKRYAADLAMTLGRGEKTARLSLRRTANTACKPGDLRLLDVDELPDPATNERGGVRLGRCTEVWPVGLVREAAFLDLGLSVSAGVPTLGAPTQNAGEPYHGIDLPVTVNADGDPVLLEANVTATSVGTRPADTDAGWFYIGAQLSTGTWNSLRRFPAGMRVWPRGRSQPRVGDKSRLPSAFVYPSSGTGYVDTTAFPAPTSVGTTDISGLRATATWVPGDEGLWVEVLVGLQGGQRSVVATVPPGTRRAVVAGLVVSTAYTVEVRHVGEWGSEGPGATANFSTTGTPATAPALVFVALVAGIV